MFDLPEFVQADKGNETLKTLHVNQPVIATRRQSSSTIVSHLPSVCETVVPFLVRYRILISYF